jgi:GMP synthase (glutamine-hydrolysing)
MTSMLITWEYPMRVLVIQHDDDVPPGLLAEWASERGHSLTFDPSSQHDAIVSLGSYASVTDGAFSEEIPVLQAAVSRGTPVLGICFGAQLLATALGGRVERLDTPEAVWDQIQGDGPFLLWHEDAVVEAPPGSDAVVDGPGGVRYFRRGSAIGVQHHPEVTETIASRWADTSDIPARAGVTREALVTPPPGAREAAFRLFDAALS